jgi:beta-lactam-binding protein with PASTA domain
MTLGEATAAIEADGFGLGTVSSEPAGVDPIPSDWIVISQNPSPGVKRPAGTLVNLVLADAATPCP